MSTNVGEVIVFDGCNYLVTQITSRPKDGSKKVVLQEVLPTDGT